MNNVVLYTIPGCMKCHYVKKLLCIKNITFIEKNIFDNSAARSELMDIAGRITPPVLSVNGQIITEYDNL
ncbi:glutaredoxin family protein [Salipaludibacillus aurantiacus]|uniref:Glutaredoxin n=1 Tax=Salipaludibacillus aurantiacus TaxID=1601833 RepID=A0A1H9W5B9_9BACI|nr:glutaredoxin [Salipaludibacillus aurantiacus]SES28663.1 Glutaredoxin [Salipaludibacillus aurantiacus]